ncbi:hypothetical protein AgCh_034593 [Apium graveolens]
MIRATPLLMSLLKSLASSTVCTANKSHTKLIVVLTNGRTTLKVVAKYMPVVRILSVIVSELTTDSFEYICSTETSARQNLVYRGLIPFLVVGTSKATDTGSTNMILQAALKSTTKKELCNPGDVIVVLHRIGSASVIKIFLVK